MQCMQYAYSSIVIFMSIVFIQSSCRTNQKSIVILSLTTNCVYCVYCRFGRGRHHPRRHRGRRRRRRHPALFASIAHHSVAVHIHIHDYDMHVACTACMT